MAAVVLLATPARAQPAPHGPPAAAAPPGAAAPAPATAEAAVRIHDTRVFVVHGARGGASANERARAATQALEHIVDNNEPSDVRVDERDDVAVVYAGRRPLIQLGPEDARAADDANLSVHAASVAAKVRDALRAERKRSAIATAVFSFSLVVFSLLIAILLLRKVAEVAERGRKWIDDHPERLPVIRVQGVEFVRPAALRGGLLVALSMGKALLRVSIAYTWLVVALSLFETTRGYTERLTGSVLAPLSGLMGRVGSSLPLLVVAATAAFAVAVTVRFVGLFFGSVARGETRLGWLPPELAAPTSVLVRAGIVVVSLVLASPLLTGSDDGALSRVGAVVLAAIGLAFTPLLACAAVGVAVVYARRLRVGEFADVGGHFGRIHEVTLLEVRLEDDDGSEVRVPHLLGLWRPTRVIGRLRRVGLELAVAPDAPHARVREVIAAAAAAHGGRPRVELLKIDADGACYQVSVESSTRGAQAALAAAVADALVREQIPLGRGAAPPARHSSERVA